METSQMNTRDTVTLSEGQRHELNRLEELQLIYDEFDMDLDDLDDYELNWLRDQRELANEDAKAALLLHCIEALAASPGWSFQTIAEHISGPIAMVSALQGVPLRFEHEEWAWPTSTEGVREQRLGSLPTLAKKRPSETMKWSLQNDARTNRLECRCGHCEEQD